MRSSSSNLRFEYVDMHPYVSNRDERYEAGEVGVKGAEQVAGEGRYERQPCDVVVLQSAVQPQTWCSG